MPWWKKGAWISNLLLVITSCALLCMVTIVVANVMGRGLFASPLWGAIEIIGLLGIILIPFAIIYTEHERGHIVVDILISKLKPRVKLVFEIVSYILSLATIVLLIWGGIIDAWYTATTPGSYTINLGINYTPFKFLWVISCIVLFGFVLWHLVEKFAEAKRK
jgi:TRAP-type C4-dicarboxylate transport system permease small subunit